MTTFVNLTPHDIVLLIGNGEKKVIKSSGMVRASQKREKVDTIDGVSINRVSYGEPIGLPQLKTDTVYIVSALAAQAIKQYNPERTDIFITDDSVRDEKGHIIGCRALARV